MADTKEPREHPVGSPRFGLELNGIKTGEVWITGDGNLYARSLSSGVTVCVELLGTVHVGRLVEDEFQPMATFAPEHRDEAETSESEAN